VTLVDSSVWVDFFNGRSTPETDQLDRLLGFEPIAVGDLIVVEVLQGFRHDKDYQTAKELLASLSPVELLGTDRAIRCAENFRVLRKKGVTVRKTVDVIIATFCIDMDMPLLHHDRDFDPFQEHLGLRNALSR
jgi:predicted nucleic acid-binding protein